MKPVLTLIISVCIQTSIALRNQYQPNYSFRVVGGNTVDIKDFPWQVSISYQGDHICGGSILNEKYVLTAAHCTQGLKIGRFRVRVGTDYLFEGGRAYSIASAEEHPNFDSTILDNDVSVIKLKKKIEFSEKVAPVQLPSEDYPFPTPGQFATVSGFGKTTAEGQQMSPHLKATDVPIVSNEECSKRILDFVVTENMLCAGYIEGVRDACGGDSGGPLTIDGVQIGIVSWGIGCATPDVPGVYTSIEHVLDFIRNVTEL